MLTMIALFLTNVAAASGPPPAPDAAATPAPAATPAVEPAAKTTTAPATPAAVDPKTCEEKSPDANDCTEARIDDLEKAMEELAKPKPPAKLSDAERARRMMLYMLCAQDPICSERYGNMLPAPEPAPATAGTKPVETTVPSTPADTVPQGTVPNGGSGTPGGDQAHDPGMDGPQTPATPSAPSGTGAPAPSATTVVVVDNGWKLGAYIGFAQSRHTEIEEVTAPARLDAALGAKVHLDYGKHGFLSLQGGVLGGTDRTQGWEGNFSFGGDLGRSLELGVLTGFYEYEVYGLGSETPQYLKAKGYGQTVGLSLSGSPQKADWLAVTGFVSTNLWGRVITKDEVVGDKGTALGIQFTVSAKARQSQVQTVADAKPESKPQAEQAKADPAPATYQVIVTSDSPLSVNKPPR